MAEETGLAEEFIYGRLSADSTLTDMLGEQPAEIAGAAIFNSRAPLNAVSPFIVFTWISPIGGGDLYVNGNGRVWSRSRYMVMAVDERADYEGLGAIASRVDTLLSITIGVNVTGGRVLQSIRESPYKRARYEGANQEFRELGAFWDIIAQAA